MTFLKAIPNALIRLLEARKYCISWGDPATFEGVISFFERQSDDFFFVQIGAYDGKGSDPIGDMVRKRRWGGILVEPQLDAFQILRKNYSACPNLVFENVAVSATSAFKKLYRLKDEYAHFWVGDHRMLSSFDPNHIIKHLTTPLSAEEALSATEVPCLSLPQLLNKHCVGRLDLLQIDAEGYDYEIIKTLDFDSLKPNVLHFEHAHIESKDKADCFDLLLSKGYKIIMGGYDVTAFQSRRLYD